MKIYAVGPHYIRVLSSDDPLREGELSLECDDLDLTIIDYANGVARSMTTEELLNDVRQKIKIEINSERIRREQLCFPYLGKMIDSDRDSIQRITVMAMSAQIALANNVPMDVTWTCADNSLLPLDAAGVLGMLPALGSYGKAVYERCKALKAEVDASSTPENILIMTGWPG